MGHSHAGNDTSNGRPGSFRTKPRRRVFGLQGGLANCHALGQNTCALKSMLKHFTLLEAMGHEILRIREPAPKVRTPRSITLDISQDVVHDTSFSERFKNAWTAKLPRAKCSGTAG